jgi:hypothetical protein
LERNLSTLIMQGDAKPSIRKIRQGTTVTEQGEPQVHDRGSQIGVVVHDLYIWSNEPGLDADILLACVPGLDADSGHPRTDGARHLPNL